jgi:hypothetical protein
VADVPPRYPPAANRSFGSQLSLRMTGYRIHAYRSFQKLIVCIFFFFSGVILHSSPFSAVKLSFSVTRLENSAEM